MLETQIEDSLTQEDTTQHKEASEKGKDELESAQGEKYDKGHQDPPEVDENNKGTENIKTDQVVTDKRKAHDEASTRTKKKQKAEKTKDIVLVVLTDEEFDQIGDIIKEEMKKYQNKLQDRYDILLTGVKEHILDLNILAKIVRQPIEVEEKRIDPTLAVQIAPIPFGALQFDSVEVQQQAKEWRYVNMKIATMPLQRLHELHLKIIDEMKLCEKHTSQLNIQVERE